MIRQAGRYTEAIGPYPGWYYGVLVGSVMVVIVLATELVLRLIALRPAVVGVSAEWDLHLRRRSARHVTRGVQLILALTTAGLLHAAGLVHLSLGRDWVELAAGGYASLGSPAQRYLGTGLVALAVGVLVAGVLITIVPMHRRRQSHPISLPVALPS